MERVHEQEDGGGGDDDEGFSERFSSIMLEIYQVELLCKGNFKQHLTPINVALNEKVKKSNKHVVSNKKERVHELEMKVVVMMMRDFRAIFIYHIGGIPSRPPK
ncbi:unnamed protein product, partial [Dovyalis caffra]